MKTFVKITFMMLVAASILFLPSGCKKETSEPSPPTEGTIIPLTTKIIKSVDWNDNLVSIDSTTCTYVFNSAITTQYSLKVGDVIVSDVGKGCLRKITGISTSGNRTTVMTSQASLSEAIEQGDFSFTQHITPDKIMSIKLLDRECKIKAVLTKPGKNPCFSYELSTYLDDEEMVELNATLSIDPSVNCSYSIKRFKVQKLNIEFTVEESIEITATLTLLDIEWEKEKKLLEINMAPITIMVGPVPVVITPSIEINAGANLNINSAVTTGVTQNLSYTVGISYDAGRSGSKWQSFQEIDKGFGFNPPQLTATAEAKAYLKPQFNLQIYGVLSPYLFAELYGRIEADLFATPWWSLYAGAGIGAGVKVEVWDFTLIDYETDPPPILYEILIASAPAGSTNDPPEEPASPNPADGATEVSVTALLSWSCSDPDDDPLTFDVYFGKTNPPPLVQQDISALSYQPASLDSSTVYYWRIDAKDDHDHMRAGPLWSFSTVTQGPGAGVSCPGLATITHEGKVYPTVQIGSQCWMGKNLDVGIMISNSQNPSDNGVIEKYCYKNLASQCNLKGGLYSWNELMAYSTSTGARGICPQGWHIPSDDDWRDLEMEIGMTSSQANQTGWRGTVEGTMLKQGGTTGFEALMAGILNFGFFNDMNVNGYFFTSSSSSVNAWVRLMNVGETRISRYQTLKQNALSVRCLKD